MELADIANTEGELVELAAHSVGDDHHLLMVHKESGVTVWALRLGPVYPYGSAGLHVIVPDMPNASAVAQACLSLT